MAKKKLPKPVYVNDPVLLSRLAGDQHVISSLQMQLAEAEESIERLHAIPKPAMDAGPQPKSPLTTVRPSAGFAVLYRQVLEKFIDKMLASAVYWLKARYKQNPPAVATDELPAVALRRELRALGRRWGKAVDEAAPQLARWFARGQRKRSDTKLKQILREAGIGVEFKLTRAERDVLRAIIEENVGLITSIPRKFFAEIEGHVMRSVATGRDLKYLTDKLQETGRVTRRRAAFIARDQNNKATGALVRNRQLEAGIKKAIWLHSHAGKTPRPSHLANHGQEYDVEKGWYDPDAREWIHPGQLINCRCTSRAII